MSKAEITREIAKLEEIAISCCGNAACYQAIRTAIESLQRELYKDNPAALKILGL